MGKPSPFKKQQVIIMVSPTDRDRMLRHALAQELSLSEFGRQVFRAELDRLDEAERVGA